MPARTIGRRSIRRLIMEEINRSLPACPTREIIIDSVPIVVEVADTPHLRNRGLMFRESIPENSGMLFSFPDNSQRSFWMKNTHVPLSIAFIDQDGFIDNIERMKPHCLENTYSMGATPFALEMNDGWFQKNGFTKGSRVLNLPGRANQ
jgi:uncharacterized membrane protein (UPF0127 family)